MLFGLKNAPQVFQVKMDKILKLFPKFCIVYIDDILVFSHNKFIHITHLHKILDCFKNNNIVISKKKIGLLKQKIDFLGLKIDRGTIELQPLIVSKIFEFTNKIEDTKELQHF